MEENSPVDRLVYAKNHGLVELVMFYFLLAKSPLHPPKFNMKPENDAFQEELPFLGTSFQVNHVKYQGCKPAILG